MEKAYLEIAKQIGEPIDLSLPVPVALQEVADVFTAEPGEKVWRYTEMDDTGDYIYSVDATHGIINVIKRTPTGDAELTFSGLQSKLEYVLIDTILGETDNTQVLARRKASITRSMDKKEVKLISDALLAKTAGYLPVLHSDGATAINPHEYTVSSGDDLYDCILGMKHLVENYGDNFVLLVGSTVKEKLDTYDKDNVVSFSYRIGIMETLKRLGIKVVKMFGNLQGSALFPAKKMVLVARNSTIAEGKPIKFVRRKIGADIAKLMGADVDKAQRAIIVNPTPVQSDASGNMSNTLAYGVFGYESVIFTVTNPKAIAICDATSIV